MRISGAVEAARAAPRSLELDRHVARVEANTEVRRTIDRAIGSAGVAPAKRYRVKNVDRFVDGLEEALRLGLDRERDRASRRRASRRGASAWTEAVGDRAHVVRACALPRETRPGAVLTLPSSAGLVRQQRREERREPVGVVEARVVEPVGQVDVLLHALAVKRRRTGSR